ncbi:MAG: tripartite tricarboxylate transporter substrate binding protein [Polaromonas sp.]|jgi:tripartite-type tricarboxylate transporter receptor subunit TctC|nr:tripartite tricarboxylate transporter substrate binding protein [Polaromonas sp.]
MKNICNFTKSVSRRFVLSALTTSAIFGLLSFNPAYASTYPERPITLVVAYAPGGGVDSISRMLARELERVLKQPVVIVNRPGAGGVIGATSVARAAPDGYTLFVGDVALVTAPHLMKSVTYSLSKDFDPISPLSSAPLVLTVPITSPIKSLVELDAYGKKSATGMTFSSAGIGSTPHLAGELLKLNSKANYAHVPYKGSGPAMLDLIAGRLDFAFSTIAAARPFVAQGKLRVLATTGTERSAAFPDVPTVAEAMPGFKVIFWTGLLAPAKTPAAILEKLNVAVRQALETNEMQEALKKTGESTNYLPLKQSGDFFAEEGRRWGNVISEAKIQVD